MRPRFDPFLVAMLVFLLALAGFVATAWADDDPPRTTVLVCTGGLPSLSLRDAAQNGCHSVDISATEVDTADAVSYEAQAYTHIYRVAGDPACLFTRDHPPHGPAGGGRDCRPEDTQCAYISWGWQIYGVTGQSCMEAGVPECTGPFCI